MSERLNLLKSLLRGAATAGRKGLQDLPPLVRARRVWQELKDRRAALDEATLCRAIANAPDVSACTARVFDGKLLVDASYKDGRDLAYAIVPLEARFAPRGAKELLFKVEPTEMLRDQRARDGVSAVAGAIAKLLWGTILPNMEGPMLALTERDGELIRVDLRSIPAIRSALEGSPISLALDMLSIEAFELSQGRLGIKIALPRPPI